MGKTAKQVKSERSAAGSAAPGMFAALFGGGNGRDGYGLVAGFFAPFANENGEADGEQDQTKQAHCMGFRIDQFKPYDDTFGRRGGGDF